jgi:hypothetical protein
MAKAAQPVSDGRCEALPGGGQRADIVSAFDGHRPPLQDVVSWALARSRCDRAPRICLLIIG